MLKILQARLQKYMNCELSDVQVGFRKGRRTRDQIANIHWIIEKAGESQENIYFCFIDYAKAFDCGNHKKLWKILQEMGYQTTLPASWEICMQVKKQQLEPDMEKQTGSKSETISRLFIVTLLIYLYAEYIMWNAGQDEAQAEIKISRRNINNLRYADYTTLMWRRTKEPLGENERGEWKSWLKAQHSEN